MQPVRLGLRNVSKTFPGQRALDQVSFDVHEGEVHALVGENGSGKSTLIKVLAGFHEPDPGAGVQVEGIDLDTGNPAASLAAGLRFVHQDLGLVDELSAAENIGLTAGYSMKAGRISWSAQRCRARDQLAKVGVNLDVDVPVGVLSAVERSAIAIARALDEAHGIPKVLVLDEPTAALPPAEVQRLMDILDDLRREGVAIVYVSHRLGEVLGIADRVTALRDGKCLGTRDASDMDEDALAELIVGRKVAAARTRAQQRGPSGGADVVLRVSGLSSGLLDGIDLTLHEGEVLGIAGIAGSGREELAAALAGTVEATASLEVNACTSSGRVSLSRTRALGLALVLPNNNPAAAIRELTVGENLSMACLDRVSRFGWISAAAERRVAGEWVARLDVAPRDPDRPYGLLSGGNKQKVAMARGLMRSPRVLVLDDPTSGVDIGARQALYEVIRDLAALGTPSIVCSSDLDDLVAIADRVVVLVDGSAVGELAGTDLTEAGLLAAMARKPRPATTSSDKIGAMQ
ncbi:sugar ABC transporter ATP-binding protein [Nocardioides sp. AE5]|uniref:sugar ABC transporter ATP-binding protein n=1 Tax=Nocardioides sp. AE5 TaxID=2962573 RepID=UPI0028813B6F|nr:sugar ABC transporter ATP-binding protein [Nocardioides sp. AE5]MDT0203055.1 sugar ABC transporter ATP-binding protein [Nocardioides sp. AE5]